LWVNKDYDSRASKFFKYQREDSSPSPISKQQQIVLTKDPSNALVEVIKYGSMQSVRDHQSSSDYGVSVKGLKAVDQACLKGTTQYRRVQLCVPQKTLVQASEIHGLDQMRASGVLGLSPVGSDTFLQDFINYGQITNKVMSFSLQGDAFTLGDYDLAKYAQDGKQMTWLVIDGANSPRKHVSWNLTLSSVRMGSSNGSSKSLVTKLETPGNKALIDTGTSQLTVPTAYFDLIKEVLDKQVCSRFSSVSVDPHGKSLPYCFCGASSLNT
jgi:hypothetical protein